VRRLLSVLTLVVGLPLTMFISLAAAPLQENPPQPFGPDAFTGWVLILNDAPPLGMRLFACIDDCSTYKTAAVIIKEEGVYSELVVEPTKRALLGHTINFFLANEFGNIQAAETVDFVGATDVFTMDLHFKDAVPVPTPTPTITPTASLPVPGDLTVTAIPRFALFVGAIAVVMGIGTLMAARRRAT